MSALNLFWSEKAEMDRLARDGGKERAPLMEVIPVLQNALESGRMELGTASITLNREQQNFLLNAARGMAVLAVREQRRDLIGAGLLALLWEGGRYDARETLAHLSLLNHSATKLGLRLEDVFPKTSLSATEAGDFTAGFLDRSQDARAIALFGFEEKGFGHQFDYKRKL